VSLSNTHLLSIWDCVDCIPVLLHFFYDQLMWMAIIWNP